jgi:hypothetical protein
MAELFGDLLEHSLEPKELTFRTDGKKHETFALRAVKHGKTGLKITGGGR